MTDQQRTEKPSAIEIVPLVEAGEDGGGTMGYYCEGHVDRVAFAAAANHYSGALSKYDPHFVRPEKTHHVWWRTCKIPGEDAYEFRPATPGQRGAWTATVCESVTDFRTKQFRIREKGFQDGRLAGIREGVNWCLEQLDFSHPDVRDMLLAAFRKNRDRIEAEKEDSEASNV